MRAWATRHADGATLGFCLESTGADGEALAEALADAGQHVSGVNPARVKYAGLMRGQGNKTDRADAKLIAEYAARERPPAWPPPRPEVRELQALVRRRDDLRALAAGEKGRLAAPGLSRAAAIAPPHRRLPGARSRPPPAPSRRRDRGHGGLRRLGSPGVWLRHQCP